MGGSQHNNIDIVPNRNSNPYRVGLEPFLSWESYYSWTDDRFRNLPFLVANLGQRRWKASEEVRLVDSDGNDAGPWLRLTGHDYLCGEHLVCLRP